MQRNARILRGVARRRGRAQRLRCVKGTSGAGGEKGAKRSGR
jgi:hypothetical protein